MPELYHSREALVVPCLIFRRYYGPWIQYGNRGGSPGPLREGKHTTFDGGVRVPLVARWPGHVPAGSTNRAPSMSIDLRPTLARLAGASVPDDRTIDGRDIWPWLIGTGDEAGPHEALYSYNGHELHAVRSGPWKLHVPHPYPHAVPGQDGARGRYEGAEIGLALFDLSADPGETTDVAADHPEVVERLLGFVEQARADLGDELTGATGTGLREPGRR